MSLSSSRVEPHTPATVICRFRLSSSTSSRSSGSSTSKAKSLTPRVNPNAWKKSALLHIREHILRVCGNNQMTSVIIDKAERIGRLAHGVRLYFDITAAEPAYKIPNMYHNGYPSKFFPKLPRHAANQFTLIVESSSGAALVQFENVIHNEVPVVWSSRIFNFSMDNKVKLRQLFHIELSEAIQWDDKGNLILELDEPLISSAPICQKPTIDIVANYGGASRRTPHEEHGVVKSRKPLLEF